MTPLIPDGDDPPTRMETRQLESRTDARFQAVNARFTTTDRRSAGVVARVKEIESQAGSLGEQFAADHRSTEARFDAIDDRLDLVQDGAVEEMQRLRRGLHLKLLFVSLAINVMSGVCWWLL